MYGAMRCGIVPHHGFLYAASVTALADVTFAFVCMDAGSAKRVAVKRLEAIGASFVDVGMGLELDGGSLGGILRVCAAPGSLRFESYRRAQNPKAS